MNRLPPIVMNDKLQKILAHAGLGSRREIETWITAGRITVNGRRASLGDRASAADRILVDGKLISLVSQHAEAIKALIYHKPEGQICSRKDPAGRPTVFDDLPALPGGRWVSIGRLDLNSSGLLLFTNNGELANALMHPSTGLEREYLVRIRGRASEDTIELLTRKGVKIDGKNAVFSSVTAADAAEEGSNHWYRVVISEGRYREVRRMWDAVGHTVSRLKRIRYGTVKLGRELRQGKVSKMAPKQLEKLVASAGLVEQFAGQLYSGKSKAKPASRPKKGKPEGRVQRNTKPAVRSTKKPQYKKKNSRRSADEPNDTARKSSGKKNRRHGAS